MYKRQVDAAGPLGHWPMALPKKAQQLLDEVARTSVDTPETRTLVELDQAVAAHNPTHQIRSLERELKPPRQEIRQFDQNVQDRPQLATIHVGRLRERAQAIEAKIARAETEAILHSWKTRTDPDLAAAITSRINHLAHTAIKNRDPMVDRIASDVNLNNVDATANDLSEAIARSLAASEREGSELHTPPPPAPDLPPADNRWQIPEVQL